MNNLYRIGSVKVHIHQILFSYSSDLIQNFRTVFDLIVNGKNIDPFKVPENYQFYSHMLKDFSVLFFFEAAILIGFNFVHQIINSKMSILYIVDLPHPHGSSLELFKKLVTKNYNRILLVFFHSRNENKITVNLKSLMYKRIPIK